MKKDKLGLEEGMPLPHAETAEPSKVAPSKVEQKLSEEAAGSEPQITKNAKQDAMPYLSPKQRTQNFERFTL